MLESLFKYFLLLISILICIAIAFPILYLGAKTLSLNSWSTWITQDWQPFEGQFGLLSMLVGSLLLALSASALAFLWALGVSILLHWSSVPLMIRSVIKRTVFLLSCVPTVVIALMTIMFIIPLGIDYSLASASFGLSFLILPTMVSTLDHSFGANLQKHEPFLSCLGLNPLQKLFGVVIPQAKKSLGLAFLLGFSRAMSDTMIALMVSGNSPQIPHSFADSFRSLTAHLALVLSQDSLSPAFHSLYPTALILILSSFAISSKLKN